MKSLKMPHNGQPQRGEFDSSSIEDESYLNKCVNLNGGQTLDVNSLTGRSEDVKRKKEYDFWQILHRSRHRN